MIQLLQADARQIPLADNSIQCVVTSPPYWSLRDYNSKGQIGLEKTSEEYVAELVAIFREVRRVLRKDGTAWLVLGDSHKAKRLVGIPWRVALALQVDGWWLRSDIIWHKPNQNPESVKDRPTKAHEYVFLLTKSARYYYDSKAVAEPVTGKTHTPNKVVANKRPNRNFPGQPSKHHCGGEESGRRNLRSVWTIATRQYRGAHFATFPEQLVKPCIKAGTKPGSIVFDPFAGTGTVGVVCQRLGRKFVGLELNAEYLNLARQRLSL